MEKVDVSGFPVPKINEPGDSNLKPGFRAKYEPGHYTTLAEQAEQKRLNSKPHYGELAAGLALAAVVLWVACLYLKRGRVRQ